MWQTEIPGRGTLRLEHLVLDLNGTIARDGELEPGVAERLTSLASRFAIYLVTADTRGRASDLAARLGVRLERVQPGREPEQKRDFVVRLGSQGVAAVGNGANDAAMLREAALGIAVLGPEGLAKEALLAADVLVRDILDALDLLLQPERLVATWRI
ncbi:MAG: HAD family hydrolase [Anaerolineae bacterium]|nr:HAD family hydrolase [Anaerolineae bacterium]